jgi:membrane protease YdiL (CAAX protease family)
LSPTPTDSIPLDGPLERTRIAPLATAFLALAFAFLLFQIVISPVTLMIVLATKGISISELLSDMDRILQQEAKALLIANTVGQVFGIGLVAVLFARWHSSRPLAFLRVRRSDVRAILLSAVGILALIPISQYLGAINESIPLPEWLSQMEQAQMELIEKALLQEAGIVFNLIVLALTPAVCEELLFRGYVQRQAERSMGFAGGILLSGLLFGAYHLRISHIVPLTVVGLYLAYVAWQFRSLWPAIVGHFLFNGAAVVMGAWAAESGANVDDIDNFQVPWYLFVAGLVLMGIVIAAMRLVEPAEPELRKPDLITESPSHDG